MLVCLYYIYSLTYNLANFVLIEFPVLVGVITLESPLDHMYIRIYVYTVIYCMYMILSCRYTSETNLHLLCYL